MKGFSSTTVQSSASNLFLFSASIRYNCLTLMTSVCSALDTMVGMRRFRPTWQMSDIDRPRSRRIQLLRRSNQHSSGEALGVEEGYGLGLDHQMDSIDRHGYSNRSIMVVLLSVAKSYFFSKGENSMQVVPGGNGHLTPIVIPLIA